VKTTVRWMIVASVIVTCWVSGAAATEQGDADRRQQAQALVTSGKPAEALPIYDELTAAGPSDPSLYSEASRAASAVHDMRRVATYIERASKAEPDNFVLPSLVVLVWRQAGDEAKAQEAARNYIAYWKASTNPILRGHPLFKIDRFSTGNASVEVQQCVEIGGKLGVGYVFDIFSPAGAPQSPGNPEPAHRQRIVLEHDRAVQELLAKQLNKPDVVRPSLDLLSPDAHVTLKWFDKEPDYLTLRAIVVKYVTDEGDLSTKPEMGKSWSGLTCMTEDK
jgi:hypothetical protein